MTRTERCAMERSIEIFAIITMTVIGISHIVQAHAWVEFFVDLRSRGRKGVLAIALLSFTIGAFIVAFHNVWHGWATIVTVLGWSQVIKGSIYLIFPEVGLKALARVSVERSKDFVIAGIVMVVIAGVLGIVVFGKV
jgi:hypothetical protein